MAWAVCVYVIKRRPSNEKKNIFIDSKTAAAAATTAVETTFNNKFIGLNTK